MSKKYSPGDTSTTFSMMLLLDDLESKTSMATLICYFFHDGRQVWKKMLFFYVYIAMRCVNIINMMIHTSN